MGIGKTRALEVWHGIGLAPDHIIHEPEARILQYAANAENIVIRAHHPDGPVVFEQAPRGLQPAPGEQVIVIKAPDLVPAIGNRLDLGIIRPM